MRRPAWEKEEDDWRARLRLERWSADDARLVLDAQVKSGQTIGQFAREHGLVAQRLSWWKTRLDQPAEAAEAARPAFLPVRLVGSTEPSKASRGPSGLEVVVGRGRVIRVGDDFDAAALQRLVRALEEETC